MDCFEAQITYPSEVDAMAAADRLVTAGLAACGQIAPVTSVYAWQGAVEREPEWLLTVKTTRACLPGLERDVRARHPYEVPQITALPIAWASEAYRAWIIESCETP